MSTVSLRKGSRGGPWPSKTFPARVLRVYIYILYIYIYYFTKYVLFYF